MAPDRRSQGLCSLAEVQPEHRPADHLEGEPPAFAVQIDLRPADPFAGQRVGRARHVAGVLGDVLLGEQGLQSAPSGEPRLVRHVEQVGTEGAALDVDLSLLVEGTVVAAQHIAGPLRGGDDREGRGDPRRPDPDHGHRPTRVPDEARSRVKVRSARNFGISRIGTSGGIGYSRTSNSVRAMHKC